jgi:peroxiredoxin
LKEKGVDLVACISVNDPFVMAAWSKDRNAAENVYPYRTQRHPFLNL